MSNVKSVVRAFEAALLTQRVATRYRSAMEHPSDEARKNYLKDHPNADPSNHTVSKGEGGGKGEAPSEKPTGSKVHGLMDKLEEAHSDLHKGDVAGLRAEIDEAEKKGDAKKLQKLQEEVEQWHRTQDGYAKSKNKSAGVAARYGRRPSRA